MKFIVEGKLAKAPETKYLPDGRPVCSFAMCHNGAKRGAEPKWLWFNFTAFGEVADHVRHLPKGTPLILEASPTRDEGINKSTGETKVYERWLVWLVRRGVAPATGQCELPVDDDIPF